ncbi:hypothetical protein HYPSUDRAFT_198371 [Hypholoma sublateritium FD-334 SS-4]|uniref:DUF6533 domain-containing protein n=1 Tax=Hypholoma sublateritium (strain FD-334 SS-4) TaxID=945553 RepID=A0A0D2Q651_HYPSF|nr:hypothetical protein HYPSUDRAFT_198371 [Hypholoma sublateritium FD-334 SS-4]
MGTVASPDTVKWLLVDRGLSFVAIAAVVCVAYDHLATLDSEIELIWKRSKWQTVQILFFVTRYGGLFLQVYTAWIYVRHITLDTTEVRTYVTRVRWRLFAPGFPWRLTSHSCELFHTVSSYIASIVLFAMQGIMMFRVSSMYVHNRKIDVLLITAFVAEVASVIIMLVVDYTARGTHSPIPEPAPFVHLCKRASFSTLPTLVSVPILVFELFVLVLVLGASISHHRSRRGIRVLASFDEQRRPGAMLLHILMRDSIVFPFLIMLFALVNLIADLNFSVRALYIIAQLVFIPPAAAPAILGPRLILNLREAYYAPWAAELESANETSPSAMRWPVIHISEP